MKPEDCITQNGKEIPITLTKWIVKGYQTYLITGDQGCGKTTYLKSVVRYYPPDAALRINELQPELNLRFAYSGRNILTFFQTASFPMQEGLNFQKKTSGTVNIIGEIASAEAATWWLQTVHVASKAGAGTHHGKTVPDTINALRDNVVEKTSYSDKSAVEVMVADALNFDIHMDRQDGFRYNERISEILPVKIEKYPYPDLLEIFSKSQSNNANANANENEKNLSLELAIELNRQEYMKRITDRTTYQYTNLCEYDKERNMYVLNRIFSEEFIKRINKNLSKEDKQQFDMDMDRIIQLDKMLKQKAGKVG